MKKNNIYLLLTILISLITTRTHAQSWTVYEADEDPLLEFSPAFEESNTGGVFERTQIVDPDDAGNNLLRIVTDQDTDASSDNYQLRQQIGASTPTAITVVFRAKGNDAAKTLLFDMDMDFNMFRSQIRIHTDGTVDVANGTEDATPDPLTINTQEWNIYRYTRDGDQFALYVNEESTPIVTGTAASAGGNNYFRFGDGWGDSGTKGVSTDFDWVTWDLTGAFSPDEQALPAELVATESNWVVYQADEDPLLEFMPAFEESNTGGVFERTQVPDPDDASNNLLRIVTAEGGDGTSDNYQLRQQIGASTPTAITVVFRAKGNDAAKTLLFDMDMDFNMFRSQIRIHTDGTVDVANGTEDAAPDPLTINTQEWNTYRYTRDGDQFALYVNEESTPVVTGTAASAGGNNFFRFGDGWGDSGTKGISTDFDWVTWDLSGAYSPTDQSLPDELTEVALGDWTIYQADLDPLLEFSPAFEESNTGGEFERTQIPDPDRADNNLLRIVTAEGGDGTSDNYQLRQQIGASTPTAITVVFRAKGNDAAKTLLFDMDMDFNMFRSQIRIHTDGTVDVANGTEDVAPNPLTVSTQEWNIYRYTRDGDQFALYVNEESTPVVTGTAASAGGNNFFRFGDGWGDSGTKGISTDFDWVTWDLSGAYSPAQTRLPDDLILAPLGDWTIYEADLDPLLEFSPAFEESNTGGEFERTQVPDPDDASNNLLRIVTAEGGDGTSDNYQLRQQIGASTPTAITVVFRAKGNDAAKTLLFDMDMDFNMFRSQIRLHTDGTVDVANGTEDAAPDPLTINTQEWNTYRYTRDGDQFALYVNEAQTPVVTGTAASAGGNNFFRFGDGWGDSGTKGISTDFDWVVWDLTGAYSPNGTRLPDELTGNEVEETIPEVSTLGFPDALVQDLGYNPDNTVQSYSVSGENLTGDITVTPPANFEVSVNETDWFTSASPLLLSPTSGTVEDVTIFVRLNASAVGEYAGDISHTSDGAEAVTVSVSGSTVNPIPEMSLTGTLEDFVQNLSSASASQNYRVSGVNLKGAITVTAPTDYQVSTDDATWQSAITFDPVERSITNAQVFVRQNASALGDYSGAISHTATDATEVTLDVAGEVIPDPGITVMSDFTSFSHSVGTPSESQSYTVAGSNLAAGIVITPPTGYEISFSGDLWFTSLTLAPLEGAVQETTLFIRLNATAAGTHNGNIVHASTGLDDVTQALSGTADENVLSIDPEASGFKIWPNPSSDRITFKREESAKDAIVSLYSMKGTLISTRSFLSGNDVLEIDIRSLSNGIYLIEYESDGKIGRQKFVKQ